MHKSGLKINEGIRKELLEKVRNKIGPFAVPETLMALSALPKTRSGKVMRRILARFAKGQSDDLCDISSIADIAVLEELKQTLETDLRKLN